MVENERLKKIEDDRQRKEDAEKAERDKEAEKAKRALRNAGGMPPEDEEDAAALEEEIEIDEDLDGEEGWPVDDTIEDLEDLDDLDDLDDELDAGIETEEPVL
jgi:hypothetical protein